MRRRSERITADNSQKSTSGLVEHLFRSESARLTALLTRAFGLGRIDTVEDVVQETLLRALKTWPNHGLSQNPQAWLYRTARNLAIDLIRRESNLNRKERDIIAFLSAENDMPETEPIFEQELRDGQLRMLFACCHPALPADTQTAIALKELCGFSVSEIARAFLVEDATIAQRIIRGKKQFRSGAVEFEVPPPSELSARLDAALRVIYLIFNEGYSRHSGADLVSSDIAFEAIRLADQLTENPMTNQPRVHALLALCWFQMSRFSSRVDAEGTLVRLEEQDRTKWDRGYIARGFDHLDLASRGGELSRYHLEAGIASLHAIAPAFEQTDWKRIFEMYDQLVEIEDSPVTQLNRAVALGFWKGPEVGLAALERLTHNDALQAYHLYHATVSEFLARLGRLDEAATRLRKAIELAGNDAERKYLSRKLASLALKP